MVTAFLFKSINISFGASKPLVESEIKVSSHIKQSGISANTDTACTFTWSAIENANNRAHDLQEEGLQSTRPETADLNANLIASGFLLRMRIVMPRWEEIV